MMNAFLTVKEAAQLVGKSPSSIRRIIYPILEDDQHPDRSHIQPSPEDAQALRLNGETFAWRISEELLRRQIPEGSAKPSAEAKAAASAGIDQAPVIEILRKELEIKNQQIATQNELLKGLSERLREGNILMGSLQQQLALSDGSPRSRPGAVDAEIAAEKGSEQPSTLAVRKRGLFVRLFR